MPTQKITYKGEVIDERDVNGNPAIFYDGKIIGDVLVDKPRTLQTENKVAKTNIVIGSAILDCEGKALTDDIEVIVELGVDPVLENNSWETISEIAQKGEAANYWSIGDTKAVVLNGKVGNITLSNVTYYAYILGINHNQSIEGNGIHFSFRESSGKDIMFYPLAMNTSNTNSGGWASCTMRNTYCTALFNCLSDDLKAAISDCIKYSDNTGGTSQLASYVTATNDKIFIPAEFELFGTRTGANPAEQNYQKQYDYYAAGNPKKRYHHANNTIYLDYWLRSSDATNTASFRKNRSTGVSDYGGVTAGIGCAACFKV